MRTKYNNSLTKTLLLQQIQKEMVDYGHDRERKEIVINMVRVVTCSVVAIDTVTLCLNTGTSPLYAIDVLADYMDQNNL